MRSRRCGRCDSSKDVSEFGSNRSRNDGLNVWCKPCLRVYEAERRKDPELRALLAERARKRRERPEVKLRTALNDAARKARDPLWHRKYSTTDEYRAYHRARITSPEGRERNRIVQANRRARLKHGSDGTLSLAEWEAVKAEFGNACAYCLAPSEHLQMEHLQPLVKGGAHSRGNIVPACRRCNQAKNRRDLVQFLAYSTGVAV